MQPANAGICPPRVATNRVIPEADHPNHFHPVEPQTPLTPSAEDTPQNPSSTPAKSPSTGAMPAVVDATQVTLGVAEQAYVVPAPPPPTISLLQTIPVAIGDFVRDIPTLARYVWDEEQQWLWALLPLLLALLPTIRGVRGFWFADDAPLWFQPFVPFLSAILVRERRDQWQALYQYQVTQFAPDSKKRRGYLFPLIISCLILVLGSLTSTISLSIAGFVAVIVSTIYYLYGFDLVRTLWIPLAYLLVMIPPPLSLLAQFSGLLQRTMILALAFIVRPLEGNVSRVGETLTTGSITFNVSMADGGRTIVLGVLAFSLWIAIRRRISVFAALIVFVVAIVVSFVLNLMRVYLFAKMGLNPSDVVIGLVNILITALVLFPVSRVARSLARVGTRGGIQMYPMQ